MTIANLTIRDIYYHPIIFNAGTQSPLVHNVTLINAGQQFISRPSLRRRRRQRHRSIFGDRERVHEQGLHNLFRNIRAPQGQLAGPAILMWNASSGTVAEGTTFIDCQRESAFGLIERTPDDHTGGIIRNNFIYRHASVAGDAAIGVFDSPGTQVLHNSILAAGTYPSVIDTAFLTRPACRSPTT